MVFVADTAPSDEGMGFVADAASSNDGMVVVADAPPSNEGMGFEADASSSNEGILCGSVGTMGGGHVGRVVCYRGGGGGILWIQPE